MDQTVNCALQLLSPLGGVRGKASNMSNNHNNSKQANNKQNRRTTNTQPPTAKNLLNASQHVINRSFAGRTKNMRAEGSVCPKTEVKGATMTAADLLERTERLHDSATGTRGATFLFGVEAVSRAASSQYWSSKRTEEHQMQLTTYSFFCTNRDD